MSTQKVNTVGIIGGGEGGARILRLLGKSQSVKVLYICDAKMDAPAIQLGRELGINTVSNMVQALRQIEVDFIVEATGSKTVLDQIAQYRISGQILTSRVAMMFASVLDEVSGEMNRLIHQDLMTIRTNIDQHTRGISKTLNSMERISNELEVLALNAGIQATRAGGFGHGFSVVAEKVKHGYPVASG